MLEKIKTFIWNTRFSLGYKLGGFTSTRRSR